MRQFVVLEHRWEGIHWDLMLDVGETLRTWAIDAPIVAGVDLPARSLPDHRRSYLDYEGEVSGGRGTVHRFDRGFYVAHVWSPDRIKIELAGDQLVGMAELRKVGSGPTETPRAWIFRLGNRD